MRASLLVPTIALTVLWGCGRLPDLPEVEFETEVGAALKERQEGKDRKSMSLEEAVKELRTFHEKVVGDAADGLCVGEVAAALEVMTVQSKGGSVTFAIVPFGLGRARQKAITAGSTVTVTYKNPDCPPVEDSGPEVGVQVPEGALAVGRPEEGD